MSSRADYSDGEWTLLRELPFKIILATIVSDVHGVVGSAGKETIVGARQLVAEGKKLLTVPLIAGLLLEMATEGVGPDDAPIKLRDEDARTASMDLALSESDGAARILGGKAAPEEAAAYKRWVYGAATSVATAAKSGGVVGLGAKLVSDDETEFLERLAKALAFDPEA